MSLVAADVLVIYAEGSDDSLSCAQYYRALHQLNNDQLVAIPCSSSEVLADYASFQSQIETPVASALSGHSYKAIVVVYGVPGGFYDGSDITSTTSRLSRVGKTYSKDFPNPLYNRSDLTGMGTPEYAQVLVCSRIDAPNLATAKAFINAARFALSLGEASGTFFINPYPSEHGAYDYADELQAFVQRTLPLLNLTVFSTISPDPYQTLALPYVQNDSFMWACDSPYSGSSFFEFTAAARVFLFNADTNNALTVRNANSNRWPYLAIANGYSATAGSMSSSGEMHYLNPSPFFHALMAGSPIGEAYLLALPFLDSPEVLFGDPLVTTVFPSSTQPPVLLSVEVATDFILNELAQAVGCIYAKQQLIGTFMQTLVSSCDLDTMLTMLYPANNVSSSLNDAYITAFTKAVLPSVSLISTAPGTPTNDATFNAYLSSQGYTVPQVLADTFAGNNYSVVSSNLTAEGEWFFQFPLANLMPTVATTYQFQLDLASDPAFANIVLSKDSAMDASHWSFQNEIDSFEGIPSNGVSSSYIGRYVKYLSQDSEVLPRGNLYYVRYRQFTDTEVFDYVKSHLVIVS